MGEVLSVKRFVASIAVVLSLSVASGVSPAQAAETPRPTVAIGGDQASPNLDPGTIALCNWGYGDVSVASYNAAYLGTIDLRCGDSASGYVHIRANHQGQWQDRINQVGTGGLWDDLMVWATGQAVEHPAGGYPRTLGGGKLCYSTPIFMSGPYGSIQFNPTIIVSDSNRKIITSYPTTSPAC